MYSLFVQFWVFYDENSLPGETSLIWNIVIFWKPDGLDIHLDIDNFLLQ